MRCCRLAYSYDPWSSVPPELTRCHAAEHSADIDLSNVSRCRAVCCPGRLQYVRPELGVYHAATSEPAVRSSGNQSLQGHAAEQCASIDLANLCSLSLPTTTLPSSRETMCHAASGLQVASLCLSSWHMCVTSWLLRSPFLGDGSVVI